MADARRPYHQLNSISISGAASAVNASSSSRETISASKGGCDRPA